MRGLAAKAAAKLHSRGTRGTTTVAQGVHGELSARARQLFGQSVVVDHVEIESYL